MLACETPGYETLPPLASAAREELILKHLPQVRLIARRIHERLPGSVSLEDLISTGVTGLIAAIDHFDSRHDVKLKTYAEYKIRGAILDSLRELDWAPRQQRKRSKLIEAAVRTLEQQSKRAPTEEEVAKYLNLPLQEYREWLADASSLTIGSLENPGTEEEGRDLLGCLSYPEEEWPSHLLERSELQRVLGLAMEQMPPLEKRILLLYFYEDMTLRDIAKLAQLHESRISQLKSQAIARLRAHMQKCWPERAGKGLRHSLRRPS